MPPVGAAGGFIVLVLPIQRVVPVMGARLKEPTFIVALPDIVFEHAGEP